MDKIIFLEGLPGVGKTTILNILKQRKIKNYNLIDEIVNEKIITNKSYTEKDFIQNDIDKLNKVTKGINIIDRGPISTLSYGQMKKKLLKSKTDNDSIIYSLKLIKKLKNYKIIYLTNNQTHFYKTNQDSLNPYGTIENQKELEKITLNNIKKHCQDFKIIFYNYDNIKEIIDEIIN